MWNLGWKSILKTMRQTLKNFVTMLPNVAGWRAPPPKKIVLY